MIDWLNTLDAGFLQVETDTQPMHVGSLLIFDGPRPEYSEFVEHIASRLDAVPRYRQRVAHPPIDFARPYWVDDPHFSLHYHLRHTAVPHPGDEAQLRTLAGRILSQRLDLHRPLWEMWLVEGLEDGRWATINKVHHAMIDGISGHEILETMMDVQPETSAREVVPWTPRPGPSVRDALAESLAWVGRIPRSAARAAGQVVRAPRTAVESLSSTSQALASVSRKAVATHGVLSGPIGPHRRWSWARADLADIKAVKSAAGCTVNDVVLAAISGGYRRYFIELGEPIEEETVQSMVPVSIRKPEQRGRLGNQVSAWFAVLPVHLDDPTSRLEAVIEQMHQLKAGGEAVGVESMVSAADFVPPTLMTLAARISFNVGQRIFNTVTTNIPGPQYQLYMLGRPMREMFPFIPIAEGARISIGVVSYHGGVRFAASADYDAVPDLEILTRSIEAEVADLVAAYA